MQRHYRRRRTYIAPPPPPRRRASCDTDLELPAWDDTIQDLSKLKLSPEQQLRRKLERVSRHQLLVASVTAGDLAAAAAAERGLGGARRYAARRSWGGRGGVDAGSSGTESEGGEGGGDDGRERRAFGRQSQRDGGAWPPPRDQQARCGSSGGYEEAKGPGVDRRPDQRRNDSWRRHCAGSDRGDRGEDADWSDGGESDGGEGAEAEEVWGERVHQLECELEEAHDQLDQIQEELDATRRQLADAQDKCLSLEEKHARHVSRTTEVLSRLEGQMRQLMMQQQQQQRAVSPASQPASADRSLVDRLAPPPMQPAPPQQQPQPPPQPQQPAFEAAAMAWEEDGEVELPSYAAMRRSRAAGAGGAVMGSAAVPGAAAPPFANARMAPAPAAPAPRSNGSRVPAVFSRTAAAAAGANGWAEESDAGCF